MVYVKSLLHYDTNNQLENVQCILRNVYEVCKTLLVMQSEEERWIGIETLFECIKK